MRKILRFATTAAALGALAWWVRQRLLPQPELRHEPPPAFRSSPGAGATQPQVETPRPEAAVAPGVAHEEAPQASADDLQRVKGIGPVYAGKLRGMGIASFRALAEANATSIADDLDVSESQVADWIAQASSFAD